MLGPNFAGSSTIVGIVFVILFVFVIGLVGGAAPWDGPLASRSAVAGLPFFTDITEDVGLGHEYVSSGSFGPGVAAVDYDMDGDLDLFVCNDLTGNKLFLNASNGNLIDVAWDVGLAYAAELPREEDRTYPIETEVGSMMPIFLDLDNDGDKDFFLTCFNTYNRYYENVGDGYYADRTFDAGTAEVGHSATAAFADYDNDGLLDMYITAWGGVDKLYHNSGGNFFNDVSERRGIYDVHQPDQPSWSAVWFYLDEDQYPELYVGIDYGLPNFLFKNWRGNFAESIEDYFPEFNDPGYDILDGNATMGQSLGDFDRDGDFDLFVANSNMNNLYLRTGDVFIDMMKTAEHADTVRPLKDMNIGWFCDWPDIDNDGWIDILLVNGYMRMCPDDEPNCMLGRPKQANRLWMNDREGSFIECTEIADLWNEDWGRSAAVADFDMDGDVDLYVVNNNGGHILYRNDTPGGGHWLTLRVEGTVSNPDGIGSQIFARVGDVVHRRDRFSTTGYLAQPSDEVYIGLGDADVVDELEIRWPSGTVDVWSDVPADQRLVLVEGSSGQGKAGETITRIDTFEGVRGGGGVELSWVVDAALPWEEFRVYRAVAGGWSSTLATIQSVPGSSSYSYIDDTVERQSSYRYLLSGRYAGVGVGSVPCEITGAASIGDDDVGDPEVPDPDTTRPSRVEFRGPWPNPVGDRCEFRFEAERGVGATLRIVDARGRQIRLLRLEGTGAESVIRWDGTDDRGLPVANGSYRASLEVGGQRVGSRPVVLAR